MKYNFVRSKIQNQHPFPAPTVIGTLTRADAGQNNYQSQLKTRQHAETWKELEVIRSGLASWRNAHRGEYRYEGKK